MYTKLFFFLSHATLTSLPLSLPSPFPPILPCSGTHHHKSCNEVEQARSAKQKLQAQSSHLFPGSLSLDSGTYPTASRKSIKNYGGWGDIRDHELCLSFVQTNTQFLFLFTFQFQLYTPSVITQNIIIYLFIYDNYILLFAEPVSAVQLLVDCTVVFVCVCVCVCVVVLQRSKTVSHSASVTKRPASKTLVAQIIYLFPLFYGGGGNYLCYQPRFQPPASFCIRK